MILPASAMPVIGGNIPILDIVGDASAAFSFARRLKSGVTTPFTVARFNGSSNNGQKNAIFDINGNTDTADLLSFKGGDPDLRAWNWLDQSGNSNHGTISTPLQSYLVYSSSNFWLINTNLSGFGNTNRFYNLTNNITLASEFSIFVVELRSSTASFGALVGATATSPTNLNAGLGVWNNGVIYAIDENGFQEITNNNTNARVLEFTRTAGSREVYENGTLLSGTTVSQTRNGVIRTLGRLDSGGVARYTIGRIAEVIIFNRPASTDERSTVRNNLRAYYGV